MGEALKNIYVLIESNIKVALLRKKSTNYKLLNNKKQCRPSQQSLVRSEAALKKNVNG